MTTKVHSVFTADLSSVCERPVFLERVSAGFPSPADDYIEGKLDLNQRLIKHPAATFFVRVTGDSMIGAGIHSGDFLIVDRSVEAQDGSVVIAVLDGELTVKRLQMRNGGFRLLSENPSYQPVDITEHQAFEIWGVVKHVVHSF